MNTTPMPLIPVRPRVLELGGFFRWEALAEPMKDMILAISRGGSRLAMRLTFYEKIVLGIGNAGSIVNSDE